MITQQRLSTRKCYFGYSSLEDVITNRLNETLQEVFRTLIHLILKP